MKVSLYVRVHVNSVMAAIVLLAAAVGIFVTDGEWRSIFFGASMASILILGLAASVEIYEDGY